MEEDWKQLIEEDSDVEMSTSHTSATDEKWNEFIPEFNDESQIENDYRNLDTQEVQQNFSVGESCLNEDIFVR